MHSEFVEFNIDNTPPDPFVDFISSEAFPDVTKVPETFIKIWKLYRQIIEYCDNNSLHLVIHRFSLKDMRESVDKIAKRINILRSETRIRENVRNLQFLNPKITTEHLVQILLQEVLEYSYALEIADKKLSRDKCEFSFSIRYFWEDSYFDVNEEHPNEELAEILYIKALIHSYGWEVTMRVRSSIDDHIDCIFNISINLKDS